LKPRNLLFSLLHASVTKVLAVLFGSSGRCPDCSAGSCSRRSKSTGFVVAIVGRAREGRLARHETREDTERVQCHRDGNIGGICMPFAAPAVLAVEALLF
jgi:hypothetical protein